VTENRIVESGTFGPVFSTGVCPDGTLMVTEGIVEFYLARYDAILRIEMTVEAADLLADRLADAVTKELRS
jgi:hypothetical protein